MKRSLIKMLGVMLSVVLFSAFMPQTQADSIATHGAICQNYNAAEARDINYSSAGVSVIATTPRMVICSIPRTPLPAGSTVGSFFVDGSNIGGATTNCTLSSFDFDGDFLGSVSFTSSVANYDTLLTLPVAQLPTFAYTSLLCTLAGNGASTLRGITSL